MCVCVGLITGLVPDRGPIPRSRADSTSGAYSDRSIPQRGLNLLSSENVRSVQQSVYVGLGLIRRT